MTHRTTHTTFPTKPTSLVSPWGLPTNPLPPICNSTHIQQPTFHYSAPQVQRNPTWILLQHQNKLLLENNQRDGPGSRICIQQLTSHTNHHIPNPRKPPAHPFRTMPQSLRKREKQRSCLTANSPCQTLPGCFSQLLALSSAWPSPGGTTGQCSQPYSGSTPGQKLQKGSEGEGGSGGYRVSVWGPILSLCYRVQVFHSDWLHEVLEKQKLLIRESGEC